MHIRLHSPHLVEDLIDHFRRARCIAERLDKHSLEVHPLHSVSARYDDLELRTHLEEWRVLHPNAEAEIIG